MQPFATATFAVIPSGLRRLLRCSVLTCTALSVLGCGEPKPTVQPQPTEPEPQIVVVADVAERFGAPAEPVIDQATMVDTQPGMEILQESPPVAPQPDAPQSDAPQSDAPQSDAPQPDAPQPETSDDDAPGSGEADVVADDQPVDTASRLLLPTTAGLLVVDFDIRVGDQPIDAYFEQYLTEIDTAARDDADVLQWADLQAFVSSNPRRFGRMVQQSGDMTERYDSNKNDIVERDELRKFLFREPSGDAAVRVDSHDRHRQRNRRESPIFVALDTDANQRLDRQETAHAAERLFRLDRNFDQRLDEGEAANEPTGTSMNGSRSRTLGTTANLLREFNNWQRLSFALGGQVSKSPFASGKLIDELDQDQDGELSREEVKALQTTTPHLRLQINLSVDQSEPARLVRASTASTINAAFDETSSRVTVSDAELELTFRVSDLVSQRAVIPLQAFEALDADNDGLLSKTEIPPQAADEIPFDEFDVNQDGGLTIAEINAGMRGETPSWLTQVRVEANEAADAWFVWLDASGDGYLSTRELETAGDRLAFLDTDGDGNLQWNDVPDAYRVQIIRSDPEDPNAATRAIAALSSPLPNWAAQLDHNADAEVSWHEFVGTRTQFNALDVDQDGYITADEIP